MNEPSNAGGSGSDDLNAVNQTPGSDSTPPSDDKLISVFVGPKSAHYFTHAFRGFAAGSSVKWNWPVFFATFPWLLYRKMWLYSLGYMIGVPILLMITARVTALAVGSGAGISFYFVPYFVVAFILAPMFATRLYYAHARNKIDNIKARTPSVEGQRLEVARAGSTSVIDTIAAVFLPLIALIGISAAISIPNYADYTVRVQVSEGLNLAGGAKAAVAEYYQDYKKFPSDNVAAGLAPATDIQGKYVSSVRIEAGEIVVTYGNDADSDIRGDTLVIRPEASDQSVSFVCFSLDIASKNLPTVCR